MVFFNFNKYGKWFCFLVKIIDPASKKQGQTFLEEKELRETKHEEEGKGERQKDKRDEKEIVSEERKKNWRKN